MTAQPALRRQQTIRGAIALGVLSVLALVLVGVGGYTLANSEEGTIVTVVERPTVALPNTPNALVAVVDQERELQSLVVLTLLPSGSGGSIVTVPTNADVSGGFGDQRRPIDAIFAAAVAQAGPDDLDAATDVLRFEVESLLGITLERALAVDPAGLTPLLVDVAPIDVRLRKDVIDADQDVPVMEANISVDEEAVAEAEASEDGAEVPATAEPVELDANELVAVLTADPETEPAYDHHIVDVDVWSAVAAATPLPGGDVPVDEFGRPVPPADTVELIDRLLRGDVAVRDVATQASPVDVVGLDEVDTVLLDPRDVNLVFAHVSPLLVSTFNAGASFRIEVGFSPTQLADTDVFATNSEAARRLIGDLQFYSANVVSVDETVTGSGAATVTQIQIPDESFRTGIAAIAQVLFGEYEITVAETVLEGVDVTVTLGTGYIDQTGS